MTIYHNLATIYDKLMIDVDYQSWTEYIINLMDLPKGSTIVELGCGTGNIAIPLAQKGYRVIGIDNSEDMLTVAKDKSLGLNVDLKLVLQDVRQLNLGSIKGDFVISPCDGLNYILDEGEILAVFNKVYSLLKEKGVFLFDLNGEYKIKNIIGNNSFNHVGEDLCYIWESSFDENTNIGEWDITFFVKQGAEYQRFEENHRQRAYTIEFMKNCLKDSGFKEIRTLEWPNQSKPRENSERIQFMAIKP